MSRVSVENNSANSNFDSQILDFKPKVCEVYKTYLKQKNVAYRQKKMRLWVVIKYV